MGGRGPPVPFTRASIIITLMSGLSAYGRPMADTRKCDTRCAKLRGRDFRERSRSSPKPNNRTKKCVLADQCPCNRGRPVDVSVWHQDLQRLRLHDDQAFMQNHIGPHAINLPAPDDGGERFLVEPTQHLTQTGMRGPWRSTSLDVLRLVGACWDLWPPGQHLSCTKQYPLSSRLYFHFLLNSIP